MAESKSVVLFIENARLSFPDLFVPTAATQGGIKKYGADFILADETKVFMLNGEGKKVPVTAQKALETVAEGAWPGRGKSMLEDFTKNQVCFRKGSSRKKPDGSIYDGYEGRNFVTAKSKSKPTTIDRGRKEITAEDGLLYSGAFVNAKLELYANKKAGEQGVFASLLGVQFMSHGDSFGGSRVASADEFEIYEEAEDPVDDLA